MDISAYLLVNFISPIAQVIIGIAALIALRQISISKENITTQSRRESIKYATDLVKVYLSEIIPISDQFYHIQLKFGLPTFMDDIKLKFFTFEELKKSPKPLISHFLQTYKLMKNDGEFLTKSTELANTLEAFATPFISGVADEAIAFTAIGRTFCDSIKYGYFTYCIVRQKKLGTNYYENTIALYNLWAPRAETMEKSIKEERELMHIKS